MQKEVVDFKLRLLLYTSVLIFEIKDASIYKLEQQTELNIRILSYTHDTLNKRIKLRTNFVYFVRICLLF